MSLEPLYVKTAELDTDDDVHRSDSMGIVDGSWLIEQVIYSSNHLSIESSGCVCIDFNLNFLLFCLHLQINYKSFNTHKNSKALAELLFEVTSEKQLLFILSSEHFNIRHLYKFIDFSFDFMGNAFKHDCMQFTPHLNYLKIPLLLKHSMVSLMEHIKTFCEPIPIDAADNEKFKSIVKATISFLEHIDKLEHTCLTFIELKSIEKYFKQNILKEEMLETIVTFGAICIRYAANALDRWEMELTDYDIEIALKCADLVLKQKLLWNVINGSEKFTKHSESFVDVLYKIVNGHFSNTKLTAKFEMDCLAINETSDCDRKAIFLAKFVEIRSNERERKDYFKLEVGQIRD